MKVGIVGWRGMVGSVLMQRMQEENDFALGFEPVFFTTSQAGQPAPMIPTRIVSATMNAPSVKGKLYRRGGKGETGDDGGGTKARRHTGTKGGDATGHVDTRCI